MADVAGGRTQWPGSREELADLAAQLRAVARERDLDPAPVDDVVRHAAGGMPAALEPVAVAPAEVEAVAAVPLWEVLGVDAADPGPAGPPPVALRPGTRPWSTEAAMAPLPPLGPPRRRTTAPMPRRSRAMTLVAGIALACAAFVVAVTRVDLATTSGPTAGVAGVPFTITQMRTVAATEPDQAAASSTQEQFPLAVPRIVLDLTFRGAHPRDAVRITITRQHDAPGSSDQVLSDRTYTLDAGLDGRGEQALTIQVPAGGFREGHYIVLAFHDGAQAAEWDFDIGRGLQQ